MASFLGAALFVVLVFGVQGFFLWPLRLENVALHNALEASTAATLLVVAFLLLIPANTETDRFGQRRVAAALLVVALTHLMLALAPSPAPQLGLESAGMFFGGLFALSIVIPIFDHPSWQRVIPWLAGALCLVLGTVSFLQPPQLPVLLDEAGLVTRNAVALNMVGGAAFLCAAAVMAAQKRPRDAQRNNIIALFVFLGASSFWVSLPSDMWSVSWWSWHSLGLGAGVVALVVSVRGLRRIRRRELRCAVMEGQIGERRLLDSAVEGSDIGLWSWDLATGQVWRSERCQRVLGFEPGELPSTHAAWAERVHPDDAAGFSGGVHGALKTLIDCDRAYDLEYRLLTKDQGYRWFRASAKVVRDDKGKPVRVAGCIFSIDRQKQLEAERYRHEKELEALVGERTQDLERSIEQLRATEAELTRSNKDLQDFAFVAAHDLQAPLRTVSSFLELVLERYGGQLPAEGQEFLGYVRDGATRMKHLIQSVREYARISTQGRPHVPCDLKAVCRMALQNLRFQIDEAQAVIEVGDLPIVHGDQAQLEQIFTNLIDNAVKYRRGPGIRVTITANLDFMGVCMISVTDDGIGISAENRAHVFDFFSRSQYRHEDTGWGFGLAIVKRIVERHGGFVGIHSQPGPGSVFWFTLPIAPQPVHENERSGPSETDQDAPGRG